MLWKIKKINVVLILILGVLQIGEVELDQID
jgi:hypothetical protein